MHHKIRKIKQTSNSICSSLWRNSLIWFWAAWNLDFNWKPTKKNKLFVKQLGHFTPVLCILSVSASAQLVS